MVLSVSSKDGKTRSLYRIAPHDFVGGDLSRMAPHDVVGGQRVSDTAAAMEPSTDPAFDHRDAGTPESEWARSGLLERAGRLDLAGLRRLIVVAAHPDDESLGAGGLIAEAARLGAQVAVVVATAGEGSHPDSPTVRPSELAKIRRAEVRAAVGRLDPSAVLRQLDIPDGAVAAHGDRLAAEIRSLVGDCAFSPDTPGPDSSGSAGPAGTWIVGPWRHDRHPDHAAAGEAAQQVAQSAGARLLEYPIWAWHWARPEDGTLTPEMMAGLDLPADARDAKQRALAEHRSQVEPLSDEPGDEAVVPQWFRDHFGRSRELFVASSAGSLGQDYFDDFYSEGNDRWGFETHWYEKRKRAVTLASLPRERFACAFEPGCAIGVLTVELAARCDQLLASDISEAPLEVARRRLAGRGGVTLRRLRVPQQWPSGRFDLIVLSEIGYYCGDVRPCSAHRFGDLGTDRRRGSGGMSLASSGRGLPTVRGRGARTVASPFRPGCTGRARGGGFPPRRAGAPTGCLCRAPRRPGVVTLLDLRCRQPRGRGSGLERAAWMPLS